MSCRSWKHLLPLLLAMELGSNPDVFPFESPDVANGGSANLAVLVEGHVSVKRKGTTRFEPVVFGANLKAGDLLQVDQSSHAKIICSDLTVHEILPGVVGVPCMGAHEVLRSKDGSAINVTRSGPADGSFPIILSPRKTKLLSSTPSLHWTPVQGASSYTVAIRGPQFYWETQVSGTDLAYPADAPGLSSGIDYKLIVQANGRSSSEEAGVGLGFSVLDDKDRATVEKAQRQVEKLGLPEGPTQFLIARVYAGYGLRADTIQRLEGLSTRLKAAAVPRALGDLYLEVGLPRQAETKYLNALALSEEENDEEAQMMIHLSLANIYEEALGNNQLARQHLDATLALATKIGDEKTASQADKKLKELQKEGVQ